MCRSFFDAAVGSYSDFTFVNLLPYGGCKFMHPRRTVY